MFRVPTGLSPRANAVDRQAVRLDRCLRFLAAEQAYEVDLHRSKKLAFDHSILSGVNA